MSRFTAEVQRGPAGPRGESEYELWLRQPGNAGKTESEFFASRAVLALTSVNWISVETTTRPVPSPVYDSSTNTVTTYVYVGGGSGGGTGGSPTASNQSTTMAIPAAHTN
jgi:hypothetical protein